MVETNLQGLTHEQVAQARRAGQVNRTPRRDLRDYVQIARRNVFTWFNAMVTPAAIALFFLGEYQGAIAVSGMAIVNSALGLIQELRAKRQLDRLAILVETQARVVRAGQVETIPAGDVVLGETLLVRAGETIVADGAVLEANFLEIDEALLTGESDPVRRSAGDRLLSGSVCVAGEGAYRADHVGAAAFANRISAQARRFHLVHSPMTKAINWIVLLLSYTAAGLIAFYTVVFFDRGSSQTDDWRDFVRMVAATITSMIPQGMVLTATWSFTLGALRMSRQGAVVQRLNAVEAMAAIDVICTDKTGTLTSNRLRLENLHVVAADRTDVEGKLRAFASASIDRENRNIQALRTALGEVAVELLDQIPFKSQNRFSAVRVRQGSEEHVLVLGAFETLRTRMDARPDLEAACLELQQAGLRVLLFGEASAILVDPPRLPETGLRPLALVCLVDELRPEAADVVKTLAGQGIRFKILSGDNPETVRGAVRKVDAGLAQGDVVSGEELARADDRWTLIRERSVFGRVLPEQKLEIVQILKDHGCHVAMIGDGVNDVLPIKRADLDIAMGEGTQASKTVAGLVLQNNNFALLPETLEEGRTIVRNLRRSAKLFLTKNVYSLILIVAYALGGLPFPYLPQQVTLLNWLVIGIPAFVIATGRERSASATKPRFLREVGGFALRTGVLFGLAGIAVLWIAGRVHSGNEEMQRTMLLSTLVLVGITALLRVLGDGEEQPLAGDNRYRLLGVLALPVYLAAMYWGPSARFFRLEAMGLTDWLLVLAVAAVAWGLTWLSDCVRWPM